MSPSEAAPVESYSGADIPITEIVNVLVPDMTAVRSRLGNEGTRTGLWIAGTAIVLASKFEAECADET